MPRPAGPFVAPPSRKAPKVKRDTPDEAAEKAYVRARDNGCIAGQAYRWQQSRITVGHPQDLCQGPLDLDHVRASGGIGRKSPTHRSNMVVLCRWHHRLKTDFGKTWRPLLIAYLERVEGDKLPESIW